MKTYTKIPGLSDNRRFPRLGKIRLGAKIQKAGTSTEYPVELPFFLLPDEVAAIHGGNVTPERAKELKVTRKDVLKFIKENSRRLAEEIPVMIPVEDLEISFPQAYKLYGSGAGLKCIGNGVDASEKIGDSRQWKDKKCPCNQLKSDENEKGACSMKAHLQVILPQVSAGGVYQIDIGSINSVIDINSGIDYVKSLVQRVAMIPMILKRVPTETHHGGKKQIHYTCQLTVNFDMNAVEQLRNDTSRILSHQKVLQLEEPDYTNPLTTPVDAVYEQSEEIANIIAELNKLKTDKKITRGEVVRIKTAIAGNDDNEIEQVYLDVKKRLKKGTSADDVKKELDGPPPEDGEPEFVDAEQVQTGGKQLF